MLPIWGSKSFEPVLKKMMLTLWDNTLLYTDSSHKTSHGILLKNDQISTDSIIWNNLGLFENRKSMYVYCAVRPALGSAQIDLYRYCGRLILFLIAERITSIPRQKANKNQWKYTPGRCRLHRIRSPRTKQTIHIGYDQIFSILNKHYQG